MKAPEIKTPGSTVPIGVIHGVKFHRDRREMLVLSPDGSPRRAWTNSNPRFMIEAPEQGADPDPAGVDARQLTMAPLVIRVPQRGSSPAPQNRRQGTV